MLMDVALHLFLRGTSGFVSGDRRDVKTHGDDVVALLGGPDASTDLAFLRPNIQHKPPPVKR